MAERKKIQYLVSYELAQPSGVIRDYKTLTKRLREGGFAETGLKSQWTYECDAGTKAVAVTAKVLEVVNATSKDDESPPVFEPLTDKLLVTPYFPLGKDAINLMMRGKNHPS